MTFKEISAAINAYSKRTETDMRISAIVAYHQARLISHQVGIILGSKAQPQEIFEAFPSFFPHLEKQATLRNQKQQDWRVMKARIDAYAAEKRKRGGEKVNGNND